MAGHRHDHGFDEGDALAGDARVFWAVVVNLALTVAQVVGGVLAGSLALVADAIHNLSDAVALAIAFYARKVARRPADAGMTFGYGRAEMVAALVNYTTLIVIAAYLVYEAVFRIFDPVDVDGWLVVVIAAIALLVDLATVLLTYSLSKGSANIRAAFLHNLADALGSVAVIVAGSAILIWDWRLADPLVTLMIAGYILWVSFKEVGGVIRMLMLGSPPGVDAEQVLARIGAVPGVASVHHLHLWQMQEHEMALDAHLVVAAPGMDAVEQVKSAVRRMLADEFSIGHATLETEPPDARAAPAPGHDREIGH